MKHNIIQNSIKSFMIFCISTVLFVGSAFAEDVDDATKLLLDSKAQFLKGEYEKGLEILDGALKIYPTDHKILEMKGVGLSNLRLESTLAMQPQQNITQRDPSNLNKLSMLAFYDALEINPNSTVALNGMALGFGNFGEYSEAERYLKKSLEIEPNNQVTQNLLISLEDLKKRYSIDKFETPTKKPALLQNLEESKIPPWIKNNAGWWSTGKISDGDFISGIEYLIKNKIINLNSQNIKENSLDVIPPWIKNNAGWWSTGKISDGDFVAAMKYLVENSIINVDVEADSELTQEKLERKAWYFEQYLKQIQRDTKDQNRYVENINPSQYVIIKYWKDYHKWNLDMFLNKPDIFPDRNVWVEPETDRYVIEYKVHVNEQPPGLPIDHVSTLEESFDVWEEVEYDTTDDKKAIVTFDASSLRADANIWVTWVVRSLGEGVLGHANLGKGVVEVAIGGYGCDGSFQLFDIDTVKEIMTHELGHSIGLGHSTNPEKIMYPIIANTGYAFCLLNDR